jgi:hypothetical protein
MRPALLMSTSTGRSRRLSASAQFLVVAEVEPADLQSALVQRLKLGRRLPHRRDDLPAVFEIDAGQAQAQAAVGARDENGGHQRCCSYSRSMNAAARGYCDCQARTSSCMAGGQRSC